MLGDDGFDAILEDVILRHRAWNADATVLVDHVPIEEASRYGVCTLDDTGYVIDLVEKPEEPPSSVVMTDFSVFSPAIIRACHLIQSSNREKYELPDAIELLLQTGRWIETVPLDGWRVDVGYPDDRDRESDCSRVPVDHPNDTPPNLGVRDRHVKMPTYPFKGGSLVR